MQFTLVWLNTNIWLEKGLHITLVGPDNTNEMEVICVVCVHKRGVGVGDLLEDLSAKRLNDANKMYEWHKLSSSKRWWTIVRVNEQ